MTWLAFWIFLSRHLRLTSARVSGLCLFCDLDTVEVNMSEKKCCVPNCDKSRPEFPLHKFPNPCKEPERFRTWLYAIGGDILSLKNDVIFKNRRVCQYHFLPQYISSKMLTANAIPTLHMAGFVTKKRDPLKNVTNQLQQNIEIHPTPSTSMEIIPETLPSNDDVQIKIAQDSSSKTKVSQDFVTKRREHRGEEKQNIEIHPTPSTSIDIIPENRKSNDDVPIMFAQESSNAKVSKEKKAKPLSRIYSSEATELARQIHNLKKSKATYAMKLKKALNLSENTSFKKILSSFTTMATIFTLLQFREGGKKKSGRRYTNKEKIMALALYKQGPRAYKWLRNIFVLPTPLSLNKMIVRAGIRPGINENLFNELRKRASKMTVSQRLCSLLFDEMALAPHFDYKGRMDTITGFVNNGKYIQKKIADHVLVFMIRGIQYNYKQPIAYSFCFGTTPAIELAQQITEIVKKLYSIGFIVLTTICDQGSTNVSAINKLIQSTKADYLRRNEEFKSNIFEIDGEEVIPLYDPPHLLKGIRNNLITKNLKCTIKNETNIAKWKHLEMLIKEDPGFDGLRMLPKLTESHINPKKMKKMKVKCAAQVLSHSTAVFMGYLARKGILEENAKETARVLLFFDELFDSVNGSFYNYKRKPGKKLLGPLTPNSAHQEVWNEAKAVLKTMSFGDTSQKSGTVPSITNWIKTLENIECLKNKLFNTYNIKSIWLRHLNQDPLENFFGGIRSHGCRNNNPTCANFESAFASLLINNFSGRHSPGANCEKDKCSMFTSLKKIFFQNLPPSTSKTIDVEMEDLNYEAIDLKIKKKNPKLWCILEYVSGYVVKKTKSKIFKNCMLCTECFVNKNVDKQSVIAYKEYKENAKYLTYPTENVIKYFSMIQDLTTYVIRKRNNQQGIKNYIKTILCINCNYNFITCPVHKKKTIEFMEELACNLFLYNWCKDCNKLLNGSRINYPEEDEIQKECFEYCKKRLKK